MANSVFLWPGNLTFSGSVTFGGQVLGADGTAAAPEYSFTSAPTYGIYFATSAVRVSIAGTQRWAFSGDSLLGLTDTATVSLGASSDTTLGRGGAAGKLVLTGTTPTFQIGGTTSASPALRQTSTTLDVVLADASNYTDIRARGFNLQSGGSDISINAVKLICATAPTVSSGFGGTPTITANGASSFLVNVGTGGVATSGVLTLPTASNGWVLQCNDITAAAGHTGLRTVQTASTTTSATIESQNSAGAATAWATGSIVRIIAMAY